MEENGLFVPRALDFDEVDDDSQEISTITHDEAVAHYHQLRNHFMQLPSFTREDLSAFKNLFVKMEKDHDNKLIQTEIVHYFKPL